MSIKLPSGTHTDLIRAAALSATQSIKHLILFDPDGWNPRDYEHETWRDVARTSPEITVRRLYVVPHRGLATEMLDTQLGLDRAAGVVSNLVFVSSIPDDLRSWLPQAAWLIDDQAAVFLPPKTYTFDGGPPSWHVSGRPEDLHRAVGAYDRLWSRAEDVARSDGLLDLEEPLVLSADLLYGVAPVLCAGDHVDRDGCAWYHGVWQYLRLLNIVSTPTWHGDFYLNEITSALTKVEDCRVLITGTADYSVLAYVIAAAKAAQCTPAITVLDLCATPLFACRWYAKRAGAEITTTAEDLMSDDLSLLNQHWDIVCTDAFLTRFEDDERERVVKRWELLLRPGGRVITTVRVHPRTQSARDASTAVEAFKERAEQRASRWAAFVAKTPRELGALAEAYALRMVSHEIGTEREILDLLEVGSLRHEHLEVAEVPGELYPTAYARIVLRKLQESE